MNVEQSLARPFDAHNWIQYRRNKFHTMCKLYVDILLLLLDFKHLNRAQ